MFLTKGLCKRHRAHRGGGAQGVFVKKSHGRFGTQGFFMSVWPYRVQYFQKSIDVRKNRQGGKGGKGNSCHDHMLLKIEECVDMLRRVWHDCVTHSQKDTLCQ